MPHEPIVLQPDAHLAPASIDDNEPPHRQPLVRRFLILASCAAATAVILSLFVLVGYAADWRWAWRPIASGRAIYPLAAICFAAIGSAAWLLRFSHRSRIGIILTLVASALSAALLAAALTGQFGALDAVSPFRDVLRAEAAAGLPVRIGLPGAVTLSLLSIALWFRHSGSGSGSLVAAGAASVAPAGAVMGYGMGVAGADADVGPVAAGLALLCAFAIGGGAAHRVPLKNALARGIAGNVIRSQSIVLIGFCAVLAAAAVGSGFDRGSRVLAIEVAVLMVVTLLTLSNAAYRWQQANRRQNAARAADPLAEDLDRAWERGEITLAYQPQIRLADQALVGVEALVRWRHPTRGNVPPDEFIPVAEKSGLIVPLGEWIFRTACAQAAEWRSGALSRIVIAINVSPLQLDRDDCVDRMIGHLRKSGLDPSRIVIEVTESTLMTQGDKSVAGLRRLNEAGLLIAIDDFGTGYSSLSSLRILPSRYLKIDRSFVNDVPGNEAAAMIVRAVVGMGRGVGMKVIAEGVETVEQAAFLTKIGCEKAQGYFYAKPMAADDLTLWSDRRSIRSA